jgi:hypothetical protein
LKKHENMQDLMMGLTHYFMCYNNERKHQSRGYQRPESVYRSGAGGEAKTVNEFGGELEESSEERCTTDDSSITKIESKPGKHRVAVAEKVLS